MKDGRLSEGGDKGASIYAFVGKLPFMSDATLFNDMELWGHACSVGESNNLVGLPTWIWDEFLLCLVLVPYL